MHFEEEKICFCRKLNVMYVFLIKILLFNIQQLDREPMIT